MDAISDPITWRLVCVLGLCFGFALAVVLLAGVLASRNTSRLIQENRRLTTRILALTDFDARPEDSAQQSRSRSLAIETDLAMEVDRLRNGTPSRVATTMEPGTENLAFEDAHGFPVRQVYPPELQG